MVDIIGVDYRSSDRIGNYPNDMALVIYTNYNGAKDIDRDYVDFIIDSSINLMDKLSVSGTRIYCKDVDSDYVVNNNGTIYIHWGIDDTYHLEIPYEEFLSYLLLET